MPPDPQHNHCIGFSPWCPLGIHGSSNASIRFFGQWVHLHGKNALPRLGFELADLNRCPALSLRFHVCEWKHLLIVTPLPSLFGVTHWTDGCDLEFSSLGGEWSLGFLACLLGHTLNYMCIKLLVFLFTRTGVRKGGQSGCDGRVLITMTTSFTSRVWLCLSVECLNIGWLQKA